MGEVNENSTKSNSKGLFFGSKGNQTYIHHIQYLGLGPTLPSKLVSFSGNCKNIKLKFTSDAQVVRSFLGRGTKDKLYLYP